MVPIRVHTILISTQHSPDVTNEQIAKDLQEHVIKPVVPAKYLDKDTIFHLNPSGRFVIGGPHGDAGLTGRKIIIDTYGGETSFLRAKQASEEACSCSFEPSDSGAKKLFLISFERQRSADAFLLLSFLSSLFSSLLFLSLFVCSSLNRTLPLLLKQKQSKGWGAHGGGAFSGKDPTKVDRSGAYIARQAAKSIVASGLARRALVQVSYAIGVAQPLSVHVDTYQTGTIPDKEILAKVLKCFDFRPGLISRALDLSKPRYLKTAAYGHFGREPVDVFTWEATKDLNAV